jgi:hypothetical protein
MRQVWYALMAATSGAALLIGTVQAQTLHPTDLPTASTSAHLPPSEPSVQQRRYATVDRRFGAAIRVAPSSDADKLENAACGESWPVLATNGGWVEVDTEVGIGWVGGARVQISSSPLTIDCSDSRVFPVDGPATTYVASGCLSLRSRPSSDAPILACVDNGHVYTVIDGPVDPGSGDDWIRVSSRSTGSGWVLAEHLYPT